MSKGQLTRREVLVLSGSGALMLLTGCRVGGQPVLPHTQHPPRPLLADLVNRFIACELGIDEHLVTDDAEFETLLRHALAREQGVPLDQVVDPVDRNGVEASAWRCLDMVVALENFFAIDVAEEPITATVREVQAFIYRHVQERARLEVFYRHAPDKVIRHIQAYVRDPDRPSLLEMMHGEEGA